MISVVQLGVVDYGTALKLQQTLIELRRSGLIPNVLLLLEHPPVITLGRNADQSNILAPADLLERKGVAVFECDRGGDVTYHGPGQLVGYPIFDLHSFRGYDGQERPSGVRLAARAARPKTIGAIDYVRRLEEALIRTCADFGIATERVPGMTGVWTAPRSPAVAGQQTAATAVSQVAQNSEPAGGTSQAKLAAIGVHISHGITSHGFALNVNTDLDQFNLIVPCGIATKTVTSLSKETGAPVSLDAVAESVARNFGRVFNAQVLWVDTLDALLGRSVGIPLKAPAELRKLHEEDSFSV